MALLKKCSKCGKTKFVTEFHKNSKTKDGLYGHCNECCAEYQKEYREKNQTKLRRDKRKYREANSVRIKEKKQREYIENKEKIVAKVIKWQKDNADRTNEKNRIRRFRARAFGGSVTKKQWEDLRSKFNDCCACCGQKKKLEMDHIKPVAQGGSGDLTNIQPLCRSCNASKNNSTIDYRTESIKRWARSEVRK